MAKYPRILQIAVTDEMAALVERLATADMRSVADVGRILITRGIATLAQPQPQPPQQLNGHVLHPEASNGRV